MSNMNNQLEQNVKQRAEELCELIAAYKVVGKDSTQLQAQLEELLRGNNATKHTNC